MSELRKAAQGQECLGRFPGICNFDSSTTVLAHIRGAGTAGVGMKPSDLCSAILCSACHDALDKRAGLERVPKEYVLDALLRTLDFWDIKGLVKF